MNILHIIQDKAEITSFRKMAAYMSEDFVHHYHKLSDSSMDMTNIDVVCAHSWFESGNLAIQLAKQYDRKCVIILAQSDIHAYERTLFFKKKNYSDLLLEADSVVFTNYSQQDKVASMMQGPVADDIFAHAVTIMEPIGDFWIQNSRIHQPTGLVHIRLLYVGEFTEDSRLDVLWNAAKKILSKNYTVTLTAVETNVVDCGFRRKICKTAADSEHFVVKSALSDEQMLEVFRGNDIMILLNEKNNSIAHYAEALSQGLPVIYAKDGIFEGVLQHKFTKFDISPNKTDDLVKTILDIGNSFATVEQHISDLHPLLLFDAKEAAVKYEHLFDNVSLK